MPIDSNCTYPGCQKPMTYKKLGLCVNHYQQHIRKEKADREQQVPDAVAIIPPEVIAAMSSARSTEDWQKLGEALTPVMAQIMSGNVKASAAQVSLIKDIMNRAYGKPVAMQTEKVTSIGVVLLPTLGTKSSTLTCPKCAFDAIAQLQSDSTRDLAVKVLKELLEKLIGEFKPSTEVVS